MPDPVSSFDALLANLLLAELLTDGDASRFQRRLVQQDHLVTDIAAYIGEFGDPFDERDPTAFTITAHYSAGTSLDTLLDAIDEQLARVAEDGPEPGELDRVRTRLSGVLLRELDAVLSRTLEFAKFELIHGRAELALELPVLLRDVTDGAVAEAAAALRPDRRAVLELVAGGAQ
jgi:predicted Zn-dependent peptidase